MTPADLIALLFIPVDKARIAKAQATALRNQIQWADVLAAMTEDQRKQVQDATM